MYLAEKHELGDSERADRSAPSRHLFANSSLRFAPKSVAAMRTIKMLGSRCAVISLLCVSCILFAADAELGSVGDVWILMDALSFCCSIMASVVLSEPHHVSFKVADDS